MLKHAAGSHGGIVNAKAMELAGIGPDTPDPPGGKILRDARGRPTGVLREAAYGLALGAHDAWLQELTDEELEARALREIELADQECLSNGLTSFQDAGSDFDTVDRLRAMADAGRLGLRLWVMLRSDNDELERRIDDYRIDGAADDHLTVRALKRSIDGALGTHGAWLLAPYSDLPDTSGLNTAPLDDLERTARIALEHGFQLAVHAIGDRGNRETLDIFERVFGEGGGGELRWRIEHAQHLDPEDIPRFAELGVVASMQGVHCTSDGPWVPLRLGDRRAEQGAYVWRELLESGAVVSNGTDAPVENVDPIANFHSTVTRMMNTGRAFYPAQRMTREQALRSYTLNAAYAAFEEEIKGSLRPGKLADITVLSRDILTIPEASIPDTEVLYTIVGGRVLYER
jgi:predicted amidohydrolase YtcJ